MSETHTNLEPFQLRVIAEKQELDERIEKLSEFIKGDAFTELQSADKWLLREQLQAMATYSQILGSRIRRWSAVSDQDASRGT